MFYSLLLAVASLVSDVTPQPAFFEINVEAKTPFTLYLNGKQIEANQSYKTEPLTKDVCVEIEIRYVCGEEVIKKTFHMDLERGYKKSITIKLTARPLLAWC